MYRVKFLIASLLVFIGCADQNEVPDDFEFLANYTAVQPGAGAGYSVLIKKRAGANADFLVTVNRDTTSRQFVRTKLELQQLYTEIIKKRIFRMNETYADMSVLDGENTTLFIQANGRKKEIRMRNIVPPELKTVFSALNRVTSQH
jgi:hypothetical protein